MKKVLGLIGATALALVMSFGFPTNQTFASSTPVSIVEKVEEVSPYAASRYVVYTKLYLKGQFIPELHLYQDSYGYRGNIRLSSYAYDANIKKVVAVYAGTVYCQGVCMGTTKSSE